MAFKIPWKHFGKPGVNEERDAKIFREWAKHTGKYKEGDPSDASTWKTRFRCALYKLQDIEELSKLNMLDGDEPYRVYRFRSRGNCLFMRIKYCLKCVIPIIGGGLLGEEWFPLSNNKNFVFLTHILQWVCSQKVEHRQQRAY